MADKIDTHYKNMDQDVLIFFYCTFDNESKVDGSITITEKKRFSATLRQYMTGKGSNGNLPLLTIGLKIGKENDFRTISFHSVFR